MVEDSKSAESDKKAAEENQEPEVPKKEEAAMNLGMPAMMQFPMKTDYKPGDNITL